MPKLYADSNFALRISNVSVSSDLYLRYVTDMSNSIYCIDCVMSDCNAKIEMIGVIYE